ncbi:hypothetical protein HB912_06770 [Listeria aquatica]|uniref:Bacterial Ig domain-containing protein n=1 Tax=Listeria aquatica TaxID=1494960 RepID=A0A841ZQ88_9LIST|nr:immunoglobulin-like domain-containing protein [Listeria aquatica]MBC1521345.1 hypothetical protein [Listeria aquatica]
MREKFKKGIAVFVVSNVLVSSVLLEIPKIGSASETRHSETRAVTVTPENQLKDPQVTKGINKFNSWDTYYHGALNPNMSTDGKGAFIVGDGITVSSLADGVHFWIKNSKKAWITQKVHVLKGETYTLSFDSLNKDSEWNILGSGVPAAIYQVGTSFAPSDFITESGTGKRHVIKYKAIKTEDVNVSVGSERAAGIGASGLDIRNISFINADTTAPEVPAVNPVYTDENIVSGTGEANTKIIVTTEKGENFEGNTDDYGKFSLILTSKQIAGRKLTVVNKDIAGNVSDPVSVEVRQGELVAPIIGRVTNNTTKIVGLADLAVSVNIKVIKANSTEIPYSGATDESGNFSINIPKPDYGDKVQVYTTAIGKVSPITELKVEDVLLPETPVVDEVDTETTQITGKGTPGNKVKVTLPNLTELTTDVKSNGEFAIEVPKQLKDANIIVQQVKPSGLHSEKVNIKVTPAVPVIGTITANTYTSGGTTITGTYTGDVTKARLTVNGKVVSWGGSFANNRFSYFVGAGKIKAGDVVKIAGFSNKDKLLDEKTVTVITNIRGTITPKSYTLGNVLVEGDYTGEVAKARLSVNNQVISWGGSFNANKFSYYVGSGKIKAGDVVKIAAYSKDDELLDEKQVVVDSGLEGSITPDPYQIGSSSITGKYTGTPYTAKLSINGRLVSSGGTFANGSFSYYVSPTKIKAGDTVKLSLYNQVNGVIDEQIVAIAGDTNGTITPADYTLGELSIKGTYSGDVALARVYINDVAQSFGGDFRNGTFTYYVGNKIKYGDQVKIVGYDKNGKVLDSGKAIVVNNPDMERNVTLNAYKLGQKTITGTYTGDIAKARVYINGVAQAWGGTFSSGAFSYYIGNKIKAGDVVKLSFFNKFDSPVVENQSLTVTP